MAASRPKVARIAKPHISSFDYAMGTCLGELKQHLHPLELEGPANSGFGLYKLWIEDIYLSGKPVKVTSGEVRDHRLFPTECRLRGLSYTVPLIACFGRQIDGGKIDTFTQSLGGVPVMLHSTHCHLQELTSAEAIATGEDIHELGGTFIINGLEKLIRLVIMPKRNYPLAMTRGAFVGRGLLFTPLAVQTRCVRKDLYTQTVTVHYLSDGNCMVRFLVRRAEFLLPAIVLLKALKDATDQEIYQALTLGKSGQISTRVQVMLSTSRNYNVSNQSEALSCIGSKFRIVLNPPGFVSDVEVGHLLIKDFVMVHLEEPEEKYAYLLLMMQKVYALAEGDIQPDNSDVLSNHELLLPGQIYLNLLREKLEDFLDSLRTRILKEATRPKVLDLEVLKRFIDQQAVIGKKMEFFLATGNLVTRTGLDLMQTSGFTIVAERINFARYISHFRSVHRGQYFTEVKMTGVRKLMPDSWGFLCPVHTPDGAPCGLLNHLASGCEPETEDEETNLSAIISLCCAYGMQPVKGIRDTTHIFPVVLNGRVLGYCVEPERLERELRTRKIRAEGVPTHMEIAYLPKLAERKQVLFPGLFLFTTGSRFLRPVLNLSLGCEEWIGPLEQLHMSIAVHDTDIRSDSTHQELSPLHILSILAANVPFCDCNQSPRNMYQCQMAKQTMGTAVFNYSRRADSKLYRLVTPQKPLVRAESAVNGDFGLEEYPYGTNAVVAVLAYTGYDMEDAMILNKSAYERGFAHGYVYKTNQRLLNDKEAQFRFIGPKELQSTKATLDKDGLPFIGAHLKAGDPELCLYDQIQDQAKSFNFKDNESAKVERVTVVGPDKDKEINISLTYRFPRNPIIGDKFSSRHGQKGVLSVLWPQEDMPFTESGMTPDVIINPNAFPSRMTIGMLIESLAGKAGALHGIWQDSTPFQRYYDDSPVAYFGHQLLQAGFNYYGTETMYSGLYGNELKVDIYMGVVYYQRLRHMVSDKYQARSTGPIDILTHQPVKGRKHHGGIRLGEMERDSLLAHGAAFLLHDRLLHCSDYSEGFCCPQCGSILSAFLEKGKEKSVCKVCSVPATKVALPFVLRYLANELAAMNIRIGFNTT